MTLWVVVPVKPLSRSKSRLSQVLGVEERRALSASLLVHTLESVTGAEGVGRIAVVSSDVEVRSLAARWGAVFIEDPPAGGLNQALELARRAALAHKASRMLVLPADLPRLTSEAIANLVSLTEGAPSVVLAPDRHGSGTNALLLTPPGLIEFAFGPLSFMRHLQLAEAAGVQPQIYRSPAFALDLDLPDDLRLLADSSAGGVPEA
jgi:2-phospho-L-lactate/phosphoenolpyruvate guanylyltransferase